MKNHDIEHRGPELKENMNVMNLSESDITKKL